MVYSILMNDLNTTLLFLLLLLFIFFIFFWGGDSYSGQIAFRPGDIIKY